MPCMHVHEEKPQLPRGVIDDSRWEHGNAFLDDAREVRIHYIDCPAPESMDEKGTILLIHGYPETSYQWRHVITPLSQAGYRVIAPDYRGAGDSSKPKLGYDKVTMATDLHKVVHDILGANGPVHVIGQDIGGMIAHAYATRFASDTTSVMWGECPLPGSQPYESGFKNSPAMWHFTFQQQLDLPELLTQGREKVYIKHFYERFCFNPSAISPRDVEQYALSFEQPGAMRAGFELYRAFAQDAKDNTSWLAEHGKSKVPAASLNGESSLLVQVASEQTNEFYETVDMLSVPKSGHWTAEENPAAFVEQVVTWLKQFNKRRRW